MKSVYGEETANKAFKTAHVQVVTAILRTPLAVLEEDLELSRKAKNLSAGAYMQEMREHFDDLVPLGRKHAPSIAHLNSVLAALSSLTPSRAPATRSAS